MQLDVRGPRFAAAVTTVVLIAVLITGNGWLALAQTAVFAVGAVNAALAPYGVIFRTLRRAPARPAHARSSRPNRSGSPRASASRSSPWPRSATSAGAPVSRRSSRRAFALAAAFLNAAFGLCLGCEAYLLIRRLRDAAPRAGSPKTASHSVRLPGAVSDGVAARPIVA